MTAPQQPVPQIAQQPREYELEIPRGTVKVGLVRPQGEQLGTLDGMAMAQIGSVAAALGMTHDEVVGLIRDVETNAINTTMASLPRILKSIQNVHAADLHTIAMQVQGLQQIQIPPNGLRGMFVDTSQLPWYVEVKQVLNIIAMAQQRVAPGA
jgi:hypothetical protein